MSHPEDVACNGGGGGWGGGAGGRRVGKGASVWSFPSSGKILKPED